MHTKTRIIPHSYSWMGISWLKSILHYICVCSHVYIDWEACAVRTCSCSVVLYWGTSTSCRLHSYVAALLYSYCDWWIFNDSVKELHTPLGKVITLTGPSVTKGGEEAFCPCPPLRQVANCLSFMLYW